MHVRRQDLGAEVVYIPSRDILVIHPDLGYPEAVGAVAGTLPDLHPDAVLALVDQVTPRPPCPEPWWRARLAGVVLGLLSVAVGALALGISPATATAPFGAQFRSEMLSMGLTCTEGEPHDGAQVCRDANRTYRVEGYRRDNAALYVLDKPAGAVCILVFDDDDDARRWADRHPHRADRMAGRVAVWDAHDHSRHAPAPGT